MSTDREPTQRLIRPPELRTGEDRSASRLELFLDLAYVLVVAELAKAFAADLTWHGAAVFTSMFAVTWWSWVTITLYANRFDTDDVLYRLAKLAGAFGVAVMAAAASDPTGAQSTAFTVGCLITRLLLLALYIRAWRHVREARTTIEIYLIGTTAGAMLWAVSLIVPAPATYALWALAVALEATAPLIATRKGDNAPLHIEHLPERFALFVILVLGESVASVVTGMHDTDWNPTSVLVAAVGFLIASALWWNYFDLGAVAGKEQLTSEQRPQHTAKPDRYVYGHLPLTLGLAAVGVGIEQYIVHPVGELTTGGRWALCAGAALFLTGTAVIISGNNGWRATWPWPLAAIPAILAVGYLDQLLPAVSVSAIGIALIITILAGLREQRRGQLPADD
ncbi:low temperature requirement protein A [Georgenia wutianyii]|uniref:Low temperature requirement protein A n=1 Tax=Georgenia wutianyii TaxID=2585135 RepID=A0ABX5VKK5_9MICO|nr:low temperature requirement protein A [Georgenia wutianyii]QDB78373.1 low temperature requirement protein A [Georgenia wutianyii]